MKNVSLILIDPQLGFCSPQGSLGSYYGSDELKEIAAVIPKIETALGESARRHLVLSEDGVAQFTDGDTLHPLSKLCVPEITQDCDVVESFSSINFHSSSVKHTQSAVSSTEFCSAIMHDVNAGIRCFVISGFLIEHCVKSTALDLRPVLADHGCEVVVCKDLVASRTEKYLNGTVAEVAAEIQAEGINYETWQKIQL